MNTSYQDLLKELTEQEVLKKNTPLYQAFEKVDRKDFVRFENKSRAYFNSPLLIGYGQTISQPFTVAFMLGLLDVKFGNKVLEVGFGSGWQSVILSKLVGDEGKVHATEIIPELKEFGDTNIKKYSAKNVETYLAKKGEIGISSESPFDRIIAGASAQKLPEALLGQLADSGILVMPVGHSIIKLAKHKGGKMEMDEYPGFAFVPLV